MNCFKRRRTNRSRHEDDCATRGTNIVDDLAQFDEQDRIARQLQQDSVTQPKFADEKFNQQNLLASEFETQSPLKPDYLHPFDNQDSAALLFGKSDAPVIARALDYALEDRYISDFEKASPLGLSNAVFNYEDQLASRFRQEAIIKDDVAHTTLKDVLLEPLQEPFDPRSSTYHIYHTGRRRFFILTPQKNPDLEKVLPGCKAIRRTAKQIRTRRGQNAKEAEIDGYFVHQPLLWFCIPPLTLRRGIHKNGPPICLIHNSAFWRKWKLMFGNDLSNGDVIDPRGVVSYKHHTPKRERGELDFTGYKVRSWRMCGESGKRYHLAVNAQRKNSLKADQPDATVTDTLSEEKGGFCKRAKADEAVYLTWQAPISWNTRMYHFRYAGIDFFWKGTGTVKDGRACGMIVRFNHLKLVAVVPIEDGAGEHTAVTPTQRRPNGHRRAKAATRDICLAKYTSSLSAMKAGTLVLYDQAIYDFVKEFILEKGMESQSTMLGLEVASVKNTRLYDLFVATAMCMIIAEWQKRETVRKFIESAASAGSGAA